MYSPLPASGAAGATAQKMKKLLLTVLFPMVICSACKEKVGSGSQGLAFQYEAPAGWEAMDQQADGEGVRLLLIKQLVDTRDTFIANFIVTITPKSEYAAFGIANYQDFLAFHRRADRQPANTRIVGSYDQVRCNDVTYHVLQKSVLRNAYGLWQRFYSAEIAGHYVSIVTTRPSSHSAIDQEFDAIVRSITFEAH